MKVWDAGHIYSLQSLDGGDHELLRFVKREGPGFPGNKGHHPGTIIQEVLRACIDRLYYVDHQIADNRNCEAMEHPRAAERHGRTLKHASYLIETAPACSQCGHIECGGH